MKNQECSRNFLWFFEIFMTISRIVFFVKKFIIILKQNALITKLHKLKPFHYALLNEKIFN